MALLPSFQGNIFKMGTNILMRCTAFAHSDSRASENILNKIQKSRDVDDMPVEIENPYAKEKPKCLLCQYDIEPHFKNVRLLSQFMSTFTGRIYGRHITGLCKRKHELVEREIKKAQKSGLLGYYSKDPNFIADPDLYDPFQPFKVV